MPKDQTLEIEVFSSGTDPIIRMTTFRGYGLEESRRTYRQWEIPFHEPTALDQRDPQRYIEALISALRYLLAMVYPAPKPRGYRLLCRRLVEIPQPKRRWRRFSASVFA